MKPSNSSKAEFEKMFSEAMEKEENKSPTDIDLFAQIDYSNSKVTIEIDSDVFDLARCLCFIKPTISPQDLLSNIVLKGIIERRLKMINNIILQVGGLIIILIIVLTLAFYLIYPMVTENRLKNKRSSEKETDNSADLDDGGEELEQSSDNSMGKSEEQEENQSDGKEKEKSESRSSPMMDYANAANAIMNEDKRVESIVERENNDMLGRHPLPDYRDDPSSIDLVELDALRKDIRRMTRELSMVKRSNADLQKMIMELQKDHADALSRVANTDLWAAEKQRWASDFEKAYRSYEEQKAKLPPLEKKDSKTSGSNKS